MIERTTEALKVFVGAAGVALVSGSLVVTVHVYGVGIGPGSAARSVAIRRMRRGPWALGCIRFSRLPRQGPGCHFDCKRLGGQVDPGS
jgi:hypothetical protein